MKGKAKVYNITVVEFRTETDVLDGFHDKLYKFGQEVPLKLLIHSDHIEMHTAIVGDMALKGHSMLDIERHIRKFYYPDMIAMNETMKRIHRGDLE